MGLESEDPQIVTSKLDGAATTTTSTGHYGQFQESFGNGDLSPRTLAAIESSMNESNERPRPIPIDVDDDIINIEDSSPPRTGVWGNANDLIERMAALEGHDPYGLRMGLDGDAPQSGGFIAPGTFEKMAITGTHKMNFLQLLNEHIVVPENWRICFPSKAMAAACPLHYPQNRIEEAIQSAKELKMFVAVHIFNTFSDSSDFYNMIVSRDDVQNVYAETFIPVFISMTSAVELGAMNRLLSPSLQRRPPPLPVPTVLFLASMDSRLYILEAADSNCDTGQYLAKLFTLRERFIADLKTEEQLEVARQQESKLINEQDADYAQAVKQDEERAKQEEQAATLAAIEEQERQEAIEAARMFAEDLAKNQATDRVSQRKRYIDELASLPGEPTEGKNATIALRLADGTKVQRKFNPDTTTLAHIFTFAAGQTALKSTDDSFTLPSNADLPWSISNYDLSAQFPARRFSHDQESQTLRQLGLTSQELLNLVEK